MSTFPFKNSNLDLPYCEGLATSAGPTLIGKFSSIIKMENDSQQILTFQINWMIRKNVGEFPNRSWSSQQKVFLMAYYHEKFYLLQKLFCWGQFLEEKSKPWRFCFGIVNGHSHTENEAIQTWENDNNFNYTLVIQLIWIVYTYLEHFVSLIKVHSK